MDLAGTTFWEFKDPLNPVRPRRMAQHPKKLHYSEVQVSPAWHQWLRHTRISPPSIEEQQSDVQRQLQLKYLAQLADERWASKASYLDAPRNTSQPSPATVPRDPGGYVGNTEPYHKQGVKSVIKDSNPYKVDRGGPSENWQPETWTPGVGRR